MGKLLSTPRPEFKIDAYKAKLSKRELKDFIYYNYGYLSSKTKDEIDRVLNKYKLNTRFRVKPHFIVVWMSRNSLLETGAKSEV